MYINDISSAAASSEISLFADDALLYKEIKTIQDVRNLQVDLDNLTQWEHDWSMEFNADKCKVIRITNKRKITNGTYSIHGYNLELVKTAKYLGVILDDKLSFRQHITTTVAKALLCYLLCTRTRLYLVAYVNRIISRIVLELLEYSKMASRTNICLLHF